MAEIRYKLGWRHRHEPDRWGEALSHDTFPLDEALRLLREWSGIDGADWYYWIDPPPPPDPGPPIPVEPDPWS